ncbi:Panthothenate kinase [Palleronia marisminoris]|uniref:Pantothenate kinase n=1 Tax=Palleronia marisminoris TaxID=315423 RepID=A0A1Y5RLK1_9RHOB|nr:nucleoside/nucleotide kinase family protein [Palleronia marisminoris]SFG26495.1 Panthothenate kinase [Palleronia marisminoris]SLN20334.1 Pantothenate kinase [Palleronia marisminoris]
MSETIQFDALAFRLSGFAAGDRRRFVAVAGAPGSGKSTLADQLLEQVDAEQPGRAAILPMDGFHYDNIYLEPRGLLPRKGAPETFDIGGFQSALSRLSDGSGSPVAVPVFDRTLEIARAGARVIGPETRLVIVEGNYLLLDRPGWRDLRRYFDISVFLDVPLEVVHRRLLGRWAALSPEAAALRVEENDLPNARQVIAGSMAADFLMSGD